jgi:hypothetical protein
LGTSATSAPSCMETEVQSEFNTRNLNKKICQLNILNSLNTAGGGLVGRNVGFLGKLARAAWPPHSIFGALSLEIIARWGAGTLTCRPGAKQSFANGRGPGNEPPN